MRPIFLLTSLLCLAANAQDPAPTLIIPGSKEGQPASLKLASSVKPHPLDNLGALGEQLIAYFAMDSLETGGLTWSRTPMAVRATPQVVVKMEQGRTFLDFSANKAAVTFTPPLKLGIHFTLAAWVQLPAPQNNGKIWSGSGGEILYVREKKVAYWPASVNKEVAWAESTEPLRGWHHVAVVVDGRKAQAYLDARPLAAVHDMDIKDLYIVGNQREEQNRHRCMAAGIDEQYLFARSLTDKEIAALMNLNKPLQVPR